MAKVATKTRSNAKGDKGKWHDQHKGWGKDQSSKGDKKGKGIDKNLGKDKYLKVPPIKKFTDKGVYFQTKCNGAMRLIACIMERDVIKAILGSMGIPADSTAPPSSLPIPHLAFEF